jgi:hypothetical protein
MHITTLLRIVAGQSRGETQMKRFGIKLASIAIFGVVLVSPSRGRGAEPSAADKATATQLFREGRALLEQGRTGQACRKLEESQRLDPGGGTLLNVALCHEREGRTATAWAEFTEALGIARRDNRPLRIEFARTHIAQLESMLSRLSIEVPPAADLPDLEIRRDGGVVGRAAWGSPVPVDPGDHLIEVAAPGKVAWKQVVSLGPNTDSKSIVVPALPDAPAMDSTRSRAGPGSEQLQTASDEASSAEPEGTIPVTPAIPANPSAGPNVPAWIAVVLGVAAVGVGTYFGLTAISQKNDADRRCANDACSAEGVRQNNNAIRSANFATGAFAAGTVGIGFGAVLFLARSSPSSPRTTAPTDHVAADGLPDLPWPGGDGPGVTLSGRW